MQTVNTSPATSRRPQPQAEPQAVRSPSAPPAGSSRVTRTVLRRRPQPPAAAFPKVALVVDDEAPVRRLVAAILGRKGWRVLEAGDVVAALTIARTRHLDLVVTDYEMPAFSGMELTQLLRTDDANLPILMISGHLEVADRFRALPGRTAFSAKPFGVEDLSASVDELIAGR